MRHLTFNLAVAFALAIFCRPAHAWWPDGHSTIATGAVRALPDEMPVWFRAGAAQIAHDAQDPDVQKDRSLAILTEREAPQHFFDWELVGSEAPPPTRREFYALCAKYKVNPFDVGELPYALAEWTQRLTMDFAEARQFPGNAYIQSKTLVTAGILSHYAGDAAMPLHVTNDFDGRARPDGSSPRTGIHARVDSLIEKLDFTPEQLAGEGLTGDKLVGQRPIEPFSALWPAIEAQLRDSSSHVAATYALETQFPLETGDYQASPAVREFALERGRAASRFTARLFLTAWRDSEKIKLPAWLKRG